MKLIIDDALDVEYVIIYSKGLIIAKKGSTILSLEEMNHLTESQLKE